MATNFPTSLDALTNPTSSDSLSSPSHSAQHANANDAIEAVQAKVGADSSAVTSSHDYLIADHASRITTLEGRDVAGLVPLATSTFSAVASVTIDDVFSADYTNYKITFRGDSSSANTYVVFRLRSGGTTTTTNYAQQRMYAFNTTVGASREPTGTDDWWLGSLYTSYAQRTSIEMTLFGPYLAKQSTADLQGGHEDTAMAIHVSHLLNYNTTQWDGLELSVQSGTFGGTINVYGLVDP